MRTAVIIVAAGRGHRLGGEVPKQYLPLAGPCALARSVAAFLALDGIGPVCVVIHPDDKALCRDALAGTDDARLMAPVPGGETRAQSVLRGLQALADAPPDRVLIHDAARPFVSARIIEQVMAALDHAPGAAAGLPVVDALWQVTGDGQALVEVPRAGLWRAQTPQGFHFDPILKAHLAARGDAADDVAVARAAGIEVRMVEGAEQNFKITTAADLARALKRLEPAARRERET